MTSRNYSSNGGKKKHKGARVEMTSARTIVQVEGKKRHKGARKLMISEGTTVQMAKT
jgi:hypothetical protein